jgi:hypothetical protein
MEGDLWSIELNKMKGPSIKIGDYNDMKSTKYVITKKLSTNLTDAKTELSAST